MKVLIIEGDQQIIEDISFWLRARYPDVSVISASDTETGIELVETESLNLVMVDSSLESMASQDIIGKIREISEVALIVLSKGQSDIDRARDLEMGADEYIVQPLNHVELLAKVKALLRRFYGLDFETDRPVIL